MPELWLQINRSKFKFLSPVWTWLLFVKDLSGNSIFALENIAISREDNSSHYQTSLAPRALPARHSLRPHATFFDKLVPGFQCGMDPKLILSCYRLFCGMLKCLGCPWTDGQKMALYGKHLHGDDHCCQIKVYIIIYGGTNLNQH